MIKQIIVCVIFSVCGIVCFAQDKQVAMLETVKVTPDVPVIVQKMVRGELAKEISIAKGYTAFSRMDIDKIMEEYNFQNSGFVNESQRKKLGEMSGADYVCISKVTKEKNSYYVEAFLVHLESGRIENPVTAFVEGGMSVINNTCKNLAKELTKRNNAKTQTTKATTPTSQNSENNLNQNSSLYEFKINNVSYHIIRKDLDGNINWMRAKRFCRRLKAAGYEDWYLPSKSELKAIYENKEFLGGFKYEWYWSSTQYTSGSAWKINFENGEVQKHGMMGEYKVRCIREK
ncbi:MAG: DUF1566 domain-containing protein [Marinifilaceae bacterium]|jgi:hypothetical protein|nr:DUF1566 domain-containing protein [Marinifilaceae bacterium]